MTEKLKTLLHERATSVDFETPDLDALTRDGERTVRRRRSAVALAGVAAAAVAVAGAALVPGGGDRPDQGVAGAPPTTAPLTWVDGSTLHVGADRTVDLGRDAVAYVRTDAGYAFADRTGRVWSWVDGATTDLGITPRRDVRLVADPDTSTVAFVDGGEGPGQVVVHDQVRGTVAVLPAEEGGVELDGLDAGLVYWTDDRGIVATDIDTETAEVISDPGGLDLTDIESATYAGTDGQGSVVGLEPGAGTDLPEAYGSSGVLSPDARYYSSEGDRPAVFDTGSGARVELDLEQRFASGYEWLDDRTLAVVAAERASVQATAQLLTCTVPDGSCTTVAEDLGPLGELAERIVLPVGEGPG